MTARRRADFRLRDAVRQPGFTPRRGDVSPLLDALADADDDEAVSLERALARVGSDAGSAAAERARTAAPREAARLTKLVGRIAAETSASELGAFLAEQLAATEPRVRTVAANALGHLGAEYERPLLEALARETTPSTRRALLAAIGKVGAAEALAWLRAHVPAEDDGIAIAHAKAERMIARTLGRAVEAQFRMDAAPLSPTPVVVHCRRGLETLLAAELEDAFGAAIRPNAIAPGEVTLALDAPPSALLTARTMLGFGFLLPPEPVHATGPDALADAVVRSLASDAAENLLTHFTDGPVRYRLAWAAGGKRRAVVWNVGAAVSERRPRLANDPSGATWQAIVHEQPGALFVELVPRFEDPRFSYRRGDVPAASHPTIAAALVRLAGCRPRDVVWDPFVGSGLELCAPPPPGPYRRLIGTDTSRHALAVARANLESAGVRADLVLADARTFSPPEPPTLVITNPPMGRRVMRGADLGAFYEAFVANVARVLAPPGRLVWISPMPARTTRALERGGLRVVRELTVDLGGFDGSLQLVARLASHRGAT